MKKILICGNFGTGGPTSSGQVIKTKIVSEEILKQLGKEKCTVFNTYKRLRSLLKAYFIYIPTLFRFKHVVMFPAHSGVVMLVPAFYVAKLLFGVKLHFVVIGGWLPTFLKLFPISRIALRRYDGIYVETNTMKTALQQQGFKNVFVMPNCKPLKILREEELCYQHTEPFKLVTFSRVMKEKGIEDLIRVIKQINETTGRTVYSLDIYGHIQEGEEVWFKEVMASVADNHSFSYKGKIPFTESTSVLASYFALVFPTRFFTEGIPGTIIDAYSAGLPVIASKWESFNDVVDDGVTGIGFEFENWEELTKILEKIAVNPEIVYGKKTACLRKAVEFIPESTVSVLSNKLGGAF